MKTIKYFDILKKALLMTWNNKFLWVFGLLIFLGSLFSNVNVDTNKLSNQNYVSFGSHPGIVGFVSVAMLLLIAALFLLRIVSMAAIIKSVSDINLYKQLKIKNILQESRVFLWRIFLLEIIIGLTLLAVALVLSIPVVYLFALNAKALAWIALVGAIVIILPLLVLAYYLRRYAIIYIVLGNFKIRISLEAAYLMFEKNSKKSLLMGVVSIFLGIAFCATLIAAGLLLLILLSPFGLIAYFVFAKVGLMAISILGAFIGALLMLAMFSWYEVFLQAVWVFFFQEIGFEKQKEAKKVENLESEVEIPSPETV
ncbi:MAG: hypothetical protein PHW24_03300 [Candidatus Moranbacteria bacterium]|nr:hypothetical protein [Candidatus Moranbacteria bacterium]